jgi:hypothetical protein
MSPAGTTYWVPDVVSVTRASKVALARAVLGKAFAKLVSGSERQMLPPARTPSVDLKPTVYVPEVLASVGDGVTVTPETDVPIVRLPVSVSAPVPAYARYGVVVPGARYLGWTLTGYVPASNGLTPSAVRVTFAPAGIAPTSMVTTLSVAVAAVELELITAEETVSVVNDPPEGV